MIYYVGIDGGGSNLRVVITDEALRVVAGAQDETANPSTVGRPAAARRVVGAVRAALEQAGLAAAQIAGAGIGIAGASGEYAADWLQQVVHEALPDTLCVPSSDMEIALVGAHGARRGVLVLAGTGSVALAVDQQGRQARAGGWGYLLGDEGSGYWLGLEALRAITRAADGRGPATMLAGSVLDSLALPGVQAITLWLYAPGELRTRDVARLAPLVCACAEEGDPVAGEIIHRAAAELALLRDTVVARLGLEDAPVAFAGGLLTERTALQVALCAALGLASAPVAQYPPVVGAALLARLAVEG